MAIKKYKARLARKRQVARDYLFLDIELVKPARLKFEAGQHLLLKVPGEVAPRHYSVASNPGIDHGVDLLVNVSGKGKGSKYIKELKVGDGVEFMAPAGNYVVNSET